MTLQLLDVQDMLVTSVACGDAGLADLLTEQAEIVWEMAAGCHADVRFLKTQLGLIELAQGYTRNQIDLANTHSQTYGEDASDSTSQRDSVSQRDSAYRKCGWSEATSWQQFVRDSEQHDRNRADSASSMTSGSDGVSSDRSTTSAQGWATAWHDVYAYGHSTSTGSTSTRDDRTSQATSGTPAYSNVTDLSTGGLAVTYTPPEIALSTTPPFIEVTPGQLSITDTISSGYSDPGAAIPSCGDPENPNCGPLQSYGRGYASHYNLSLSLPTVGGITVSWSTGANFRQSFVCSSGSTTGDGTSQSRSETEAEDTGRGERHALTHDESTRQQAVSRSSDSDRDSASNSSAYARGLMGSLGQTDSGADSASHSEQTATGTGSAASNSHAESLATGYTDSVSTSDAAYWSQIFGSLQDMWQRVLDEIRQFERIHAASSAFAAGAIAATLGRGSGGQFNALSHHMTVRPASCAIPGRCASTPCQITELGC